jgi:hypothetical protein
MFDIASCQQPQAGTPVPPFRTASPPVNNHACATIPRDFSRHRLPISLGKASGKWLGTARSSWFTVRSCWFENGHAGKSNDLKTLRLAREMMVAIYRATGPEP